MTDAPEAEPGVVDTDGPTSAAVVGVGGVIDASHVAAHEPGTRGTGAIATKEGTAFVAAVARTLV